MLTLNLVARPPLQFAVVYCSESLRCSGTLPCAEAFAPAPRTPVTLQLAVR
jgi:hypothetical protein